MTPHGVTDMVALFLRITIGLLRTNNEEKPRRTWRFTDLSHTHAAIKPVLRLHRLPNLSIAHFDRIDREC